VREHVPEDLLGIPTAVVGQVAPGSVDPDPGDPRDVAEVGRAVLDLDADAIAAVRVLDLAEGSVEHLPPLEDHEDEVAHRVGGPR
jgi:hypothetical protein